MLILGLTGSIAMGKSTMAMQFRQEGIPVHDADQAVHDLMAAGGAATAQVASLFPEAQNPDGSIDRPSLGRLVFNNGEARQQLEGILHPLVRQNRDDWLKSHEDDGAWCVALDVPLLFETGGEKDCDATVVATTSPYQQRIRALSRPGMTPDRLDAILELQMPDKMKRDHADFVIPTSYGRLVSLFYIRQCLEQCRLFGASFKREQPSMKTH